jgi:proline iminopeptidase
MKRMVVLIIVALAFGACAKEPSPNKAASAGYLDYSERDDALSGGVRLIPISTPKGTFRVWTKRVGNNPKIKVLLLHGGPGATHEYFEAFDSYFPAAEIEYYYYDQLGSAFSDQPSEPDLWDLPRFVEEVEQVRQALKLDHENFYLLGHSWGGILAMEYALKYQQHLAGLVISNMIPHHYVHHFLRMPPEEWPDPVNRAFKRINPAIYVPMQGPSELGASGKLVKWDRTADLGKITVPTLVIGAQHDTMDPKHMEWMAGAAGKGRYLYCPNGSHMALYDDQKVYFGGLIQFIRDVNAGRF